MHTIDSIRVQWSRHTIDASEGNGVEKARMLSSGIRRPLKSHAGCNRWVEHHRHNIGWLREHVGHCDTTCGAPGANSVDRGVLMVAGTTDEVVGWLLRDIHLWGDECTNGHWSAPWDRHSSRQWVSHWKCHSTTM